MALVEHLMEVALVEDLTELALVEDLTEVELVEDLTELALVEDLRKSMSQNRLKPKFETTNRGSRNRKDKGTQNHANA